MKSILIRFVARIALVFIRNQFYIFPPERSPGGSEHGELANFIGLVLGCIEADFCKQIGNTHLKPLAEISTIHSFALHSNLHFF